MACPVRAGAGAGGLGQNVLTFPRHLLLCGHMFGTRSDTEQSQADLLSPCHCLLTSVSSVTEALDGRVDEEPLQRHKGYCISEGHEHILLFTVPTYISLMESNQGAVPSSSCPHDHLFIITCVWKTFVCHMVHVVKASIPPFLSKPNQVLLLIKSEQTATEHCSPVLEVPVLPLFTYMYIV